MDEATYTATVPREETTDSSARLFSFARVRGGVSTRFFPGAGTRLRYLNREADSLDVPGVPSGFLRAGDAVAVSWRGERVFIGDVERISETRSRGSDATQSVVCLGPWAKMARLVYRQYWATGEGMMLSSRLILNETQSGAAQNLDSELREIAQHGASACGYQVGTISVSTQTLPSDECRDITVAEAIRRELRLFPKAVVRFDYSTEPPTLNVVRGEDGADSASYVASSPKTARAYEYSAHPITGVDLEIVVDGEVDGVAYSNIAHQTAGDTTAGNPDCLYATLQLRGASSSSVKQSYRSVTEEIPADLSDPAWWKARHPRLANVPVGQITITEATRDPAKYSRISAGTAGELDAAGISCEVSTFSCYARIASADDDEAGVYLSLQYLTTNAEGTAEKPKVYSWVTESSSESGETVPDGLAAAILAERAGALVSERLVVRLGDAIPRLGDAIAEENGTVFLQTVDIDCCSLVADLAFGVPERLSPEDMAALLSSFRNKRTTTSRSWRRDGRRKQESEVEMGAIPPLSSSEFAPGQKAKTTIASHDKSGGSIVLDSADLDVSDEIRARTWKWAYGDTPTKTVKVMAAADVTSGMKRIVAGNGIVVTDSDDGSTITISAAGSGSSDGSSDGSGSTVGQGGTVVVATNPRYDATSHRLLYTPVSITFDNGRLSKIETGVETMIAQAVEECA